MEQKFARVVCSIPGFPPGVINDVAFELHEKGPDLVSTAAFDDEALQRLLTIPGYKLLAVDCEQADRVSKALAAAEAAEKERLAQEEALRNPQAAVVTEAAVVTAPASTGTLIDPANVSDPNGPQPVLQTVESKTYTDGTVVTGTPPLPDQSPAQQHAAAADAAAAADGAAADLVKADAGKADEVAQSNDEAKPKDPVDSPEVAAAKALLGSAPAPAKKGGAKNK